MSLLRTISRFLLRVEYGFVVTLLGSMVLLSFTQVVLRNAFGTGLVWADTVIRHIVLWLAFAGAAIVTVEERHISIDALTQFLPPRVKHASSVITNLFAIVVCAVLAEAAWTFLLDEKGAGGELVLNLPTWVALTIIPAGYAVMGFHFLVRTGEHILGLAGRKAEGT